MLYLLSQHFPEDCVMVMINKYFYDVYFAEPDVQTATRSEINGPHWSATRFLGDYIMLTFPDGMAESIRVDALIDTIFPDLKPYLKNQRPCGNKSLTAKTTSVNYTKFCFGQLSSEYVGNILITTFILDGNDWL